MRIGIPIECFENPNLNSEVKKEVLKAADILRQKGAVVSEFSLDVFDYAVATYYIIALAQASSNLARYDGVKYGERCREYDGIHGMYKNTRTNFLGEEVKRRIMLGSFVLSSGYYEDYYLKALKIRTKIIEKLKNAFKEFDIILTPVSGQTAAKLGESLVNPVDMYKEDIYTVIANLTGMPAMSLPCGVDGNGLFIGLSLMADNGMEDMLVRCGYSYERSICPQ